MNNPFEPPATQTPYTFLNLGAGVQSSTLALMAACGEITPMPDAAIFADTQAEPDSVYEWLDWLKRQLPYPVYTVTKGSLTKGSLTPSVREKESGKEKAGGSYMRRLIPLFGITPDGKVTAAIGRKCTADYKVQPIEKKVKELAQIKRGQKEISVTQWIGISWDEMSRAKTPKHKWQQFRYPLLEMEMKRHHCLEWMRQNNYPTPPRSACFYCPFHDNIEWRKLRNEEPEAFQQAVQFDKEIRKAYKDNDPTMKMEVYVHKSCLPLSEVDLDSEEDKGQQNFNFINDCEGMCGV